MNSRNLEKSARYRLLADLCGILPGSAKAWLRRNGKKIDDPVWAYAFLVAHGWIAPLAIREVTDRFVRDPAIAVDYSKKTIPRDHEAEKGRTTEN